MKCFHLHVAASIDLSKAKVAALQWTTLSKEKKTLDIKEWVDDRMRTLKIVRILKMIAEREVNLRNKYSLLARDEIFMERLRNIPYMEWMILFCGELLIIGQSKLEKNIECMLSSNRIFSEEFTSKMIDEMEHRLAFEKAIGWVSSFLDGVLALRGSE